MIQIDAAEIMKSIVENNYFKVSSALNEKLGIPNSLLGVPKDGLRGYVNSQRFLNFCFYDKLIITQKGNYADTDAVSNDSACYKPFLPGLMISTENLERDAIAAQLPENALLEILILHELTHVAMIGKFVHKENTASAEWIESEEIRYIHETAALKACESAFSEIYQVANQAHVKKYLDYVKNQAEISEQGHYYSPYFSQFQTIADDQFWRALAESTSFQWDQLRVQEDS